MANNNEKPKVMTKKHVARAERERRQVQIVWTVSIVMGIIVVLLLAYGFLETNYFSKQEPVAEVNGEKITVAEWQDRVQWQRINLVNLLQQYQFYQDQFGMDVSQQIQEVQLYLQSPEAIGELVLDQMVDEALIRQEAEKRGITVSDEEVDKAIQEAFNYYPDGTPVPTLTPTAFEYPTLTSEQLTLYPSTATPTTAPTATTEPTSTPDPSITPSATFTAAPPTPTFVPEDANPTATPYTAEGFESEFQKTLDEYKTYGISEETFRAAYRSNLLREKVLETMGIDQPTSEEQAWARHILVDTEGQAQTVLGLLAGGSSFARIAETFSKDKGSGANGGDLGWFGKGAMVAEFEEAAFNQPIGEIGQPVKTQFGYHIIQVLNRLELPISPSQLQQNQETAFTEWLNATKEQAAITKFESWKEKIPPAPALGQ